MRKYALAIVLAVLTTLPVWAEDASPEPQFDIELIVFRHLSPDDSELQIEPTEEEEEPPWRRRRFTPLTPDELRLVDVSQRLMQSRDWSPILHYGWRQPVPSREDANAVAIAGTRRGAYVSGDVIVSLERFLRLQLELQMDPGTGTSYKLEQARRMRSGKVHYFDHPQFGVIALISRAPATATTP